MWLGGDIRRTTQRQTTSIRLSEDEKAMVAIGANDQECSGGELHRALIRIYDNNRSRGGHLIKEVAEMIREMRGMRK